MHVKAGRALESTELEKAPPVTALCCKLCDSELKMDFVKVKATVSKMKLQCQYVNVKLL